MATSYKKTGTAGAAGDPGQNVKLTNQVSGSAPGGALVLYQYAGGGAAGYGPVSGHTYGAVGGYGYSY